MLKRSYARACIVMNAVALVIFIVLFFMDSRMTLWQVCFWTAWSMVVVPLIIRFKYFKCPNCGKGDAVLQWSKSGTKHCKKCGKPFEYDK